MKVGIIGFGNLGRALAAGLIKSGHDGTELFVCEADPDCLALAKEKPYCATASDDVNFVIRNSDLIFFVIKSYVFEEISTLVDRSGFEGKTVVSFMAGVTFDLIYSLLGNVRLVRAMPSLGIASCDGVIGYTESPKAVAEIFHKLGYAFEVKPDEIEKVMALSGCGLGFAAYLIDALSAAGGTMGFSPDVCAAIAAKTFQNAIDRGDFRETMCAVATKGGATEQGIRHMDGSGVYTIVADAVRKAYERMT